MKIFDKKTILITGGAMGLGFAAAKILAKKGANLSIVDYNEEALSEAKKEIQKENSDIKIITILADVSDEKAVKNYVDKTVKEFGTIDGFYNNAGIEGKQALLADYDVETFKKVIDINLMGVFYGMKYVIPVMKKNGGGKIVNVASVGGIRGVLNEVPYVASKHAVSGMTKNAAIEYGKDNIFTNAIAPGAILTPMVAESFKQVNPENPQAAQDEFSKNNPTGNLGQPENVGYLVAFLLSDECQYINGQTIAIDGGQSNMYGNP